MYILQGKTRPICHTLSTLGPHMALDNTYLMWSTYSNISQVANRFGWISLLLRNRDFWLHPQHVGWPICGSPHNQWSSRLKPNFCWWQATRLTGPIYQHVISTFNTCSRGLTHRSLTDTGGGYNLRGAFFSYTTPWPSQPTVSTFHLKAPPDLQLNHIPPTKVPKFEI
jgi:hypothetical protein